MSSLVLIFLEGTLIRVIARSVTVIVATFALLMCQFVFLEIFGLVNCLWRLNNGE